MELYVALITLFTFIIVILLSFILIQFSVLRHTVNNVKDISQSLNNKIDNLFIYIKRIIVNTNDSADWLENIYRKLNEFIYNKSNIKCKKNKSNFTEEERAAIICYFKKMYENSDAIRDYLFRIDNILDNMLHLPSRPSQLSNNDNHIKENNRKFSNENYNEPGDI